MALSAINVDQKLTGIERIIIMKKCRICEKSIPNDSIFCPFCGERILNVVEERNDKYIEPDESLSSCQSEVLLKRAFLFLEEGNFDRAIHYVETVLNRDPENAQAYLVKLMVDVCATDINDLSQSDCAFDNNINYKRAVRFADVELKNKLILANSECIANVSKRKAEELARQEELHSRQIIEEKEAVYREATQLIQNADILSYDDAIKSLKKAIELLSTNSDYKDSTELQNICNKAIKYRIADFKMYSNYIPDLEDAMNEFLGIVDFRDSKEKIEECKIRIEEVNRSNRIDKISTIIAWLAAIAIIAIAIVSVLLL